MLMRIAGVSMLMGLAGVLVLVLMLMMLKLKLMRDASEKQRGSVLSLYLEASKIWHEAGYQIHKFT